MSTVKLTAESKYGFSGQYIARITGRDPKVQFSRSFVGNRYGKRNEGSSYETDEIGLYEECDVDKHGKTKSYALVLPYNEVLKKLYADKDEALAIAKRLDGGERLEDIVSFVRGEPLTLTEYYSTCSACGQELGGNEKCVQHPTSHQTTQTRQVPQLRDDGTQKHALIYTIHTKSEVKTEQAAATIDSAVAAIVVTLQALPEPLQRKALAAAKAQLFPKAEPPKAE